MANDLRRSFPELFLEADVPCTIARTVIRGNNRTWTSTIENELQDVYKASTYNEQVVEMHEAWKKLHELGIFKSVQCHLAPVPGGDSRDMQAVIIVEEMFPFQANVGVRHANGTQMAGVDGSSINLLGAAETISADIQQNSRDVHAELSVQRKNPFRGCRSARVSGYRKFVSWEEASSCSEKLHGAQVQCQSSSGGHMLRFTAERRDTVVERFFQGTSLMNASPAVVEELSRPSLKCSVRHLWLLQPHANWKLDQETEVAGLGGDVTFLKSQTTLRSKHRLSKSFWGQPGLGLMTLFRCGTLLPLTALPGKVSGARLFHDRFFLGGSSFGLLQGFAPRGAAGETSDRPRSADLTLDQTGPAVDALGGDILASASAALDIPAPVFTDAGARVVVQASAGNLIPRSEWKGFRSFLDGFRTSVGVGLSLPMGPIKILAMYSHILRAFTGDRVQSFQLSVI